VVRSPRGRRAPHLTMLSSTELLLSSATATTATGNRLLRAFSSTCVRACPLTMSWQITAMAHAAIAANLNQAFNVHLHFAAQIAFNLIVLRNEIAQGIHFVLGQILDACVRINARFLNDPTGTSGTNPKM